MPNREIPITGQGIEQYFHPGNLGKETLLSISDALYKVSTTVLKRRVAGSNETEHRSYLT